MKRGSTTFLKVVILFMALIVLTALLWFPQIEGRASNLDLLSIYLDPFIAYIYLSSIPFFTALYQAFRLLGYIEKNKAFSQAAVNKLRNIKYCAILIICLLIGAIAFIRFAVAGDDPAGAIAIGICAMFASTVIATAAAVFQALLQSAVDIKSENDLTV